MKRLHLTIMDREDSSDEFYRQSYGKDAIVTRLGRINLVHLDNPSDRDIQFRIKETIIEQETMGCDCPVCQDFKDHPLDIVYFDEAMDMSDFV